MKYKTILIILLLLFSTYVNAQQSVTVPLKIENPEKPVGAVIPRIVNLKIMESDTDADVAIHGTKLFGEIQLGDQSYGNRFAVLFDKSGTPESWVVYIDTNANGRFGDDPSITWKHDGEGQFLATIQCMVSIDENRPPVAHTIMVLRQLEPGIAERIFYFRHFHHQGMIKIADKKYKTVLLDLDSDGLLIIDNPEYMTEIYADIDNNDYIQFESGSAELIKPGTPFSIGGQSWKIESVSEREMILVSSEEKADNLKMIQAGYKAPAFKGETLDGTVVALNDFTGSPVLMDFWSTTCKPCMASVPELQVLIEKYKDRGLRIVSINLDEMISVDYLSEKQKNSYFVQYRVSDEKQLQQALHRRLKQNVSDIVRRKDMSWIHLFDGRGMYGEIAQLYRVTAMPTLILIDEEGTIQARSFNLDEIETKLKQILKK